MQRAQDHRSEGQSGRLASALGFVHAGVRSFLTRRAAGLLEREEAFASALRQYEVEMRPLTQQEFNERLTPTKRAVRAFMKAELRHIAEIVKREQHALGYGRKTARRVQKLLVKRHFGTIDTLGLDILWGRFVIDRYAFSVPVPDGRFDEADRSVTVGYKSMADGRIIQPAQHYRLKTSDRFKFRPIKAKI